VRRLLSTAADEVRPEDEYAVPVGTPWLRANMVSTIDGAVTDPEGLSGGISDPADRSLFKVLRSLCDAVVVGARTAQTEGYRRARRPVVLLTRSLALDLTAPLLAEPRTEDLEVVLVLAPAAAPGERVAQVQAHAESVGGIELGLVPGDEGLDLAESLRLLRARGLDHLLCEGGPALLTSLVAEGLVDELCLTTSPLVAGGGAGRILRGSGLADAQRWHLAGLCEEDGSLFARWQPGSH
jgi:riboflavin biosynthesis pyrimidine reductase